MNKIKVGAVSYLNTLPLLYGFTKTGILNNIELVEDYPARIATMLLNDNIDLGLVPVTVIKSLQEHYIVSNYCIAADDEVASVAIFSNKPLEEITHVFLDYQSSTSVNLTKILFKHFWKKEVEFIDASENYINEIDGSTAGLIIGDRALDAIEHFTFQYDIAKAWKSLTGLPFVFAAWVANKTLPTNFIEQFNIANAIGLNKIEEVIEQIEYKNYDLKKYFTQNISYVLDDEKRKGLALFLKLTDDL